MKNLIFIILVGHVIALCLGCQHVPKYDAIRKTYSDTIPELWTENSFAFVLDEHTYYFAPLRIDENGYRCTYYLGFKDEKLTYKFLDRDLNRLKGVYEEEIPILPKMKKALSIIEQLSATNKSCAENGGQKYQGKINEASDNTLTFVVYSPAIVLSVFFGADVYINAIKDSIFDRKLKKIRLGMSDKQTLDILNESTIVSKSDDLEIHRIQRKNRSFVFVYDKDKLIAYVWGYGKI